jgi:hypothetical protein
VRLLDTRPSAALQAGQPRTLNVTKRRDGSPSGVPTNASAVILNVTAVAPTRDTVLKVYPGPTAPVVSNVNPARGVTVANLVVVRVDDATDTVRLLSSAGAVHVVVDLAGWFVPGSGDVFHPVTPFRVLDTRSGSPVTAGAPRLLGLAGATSLPFSAKAVALNLTAVRPTADTFVTAYPAVTGSSTPPLGSNLNLLRDQVVPNAAVVATGAGGAIRLANASQSVDLVVDVAGWFGPAGDGWDISWPQCTASGATTSTHPTGGAFAVVGLTHGTFTPNSCLSSEWAWATSLSSEPAAYLNTDADVTNPHWADPGPRAASCSAQQTSSACGYNYGWNLAGSAASAGIPAGTGGGKPMVWLDVEGPYTNGPFWTNDVATNRGVVSGAVARLQALGYRVGIYSDRASSSAPDWKNLFGVGFDFPTVQEWVFRAVSSTAPTVCSATEAFASGPVVMEQISTTQSGQSYDVDHTC